MARINELAFIIANKELGVKEVPGSGNNPKIVEYHQACTLKATSDSVAWCSAFMNWCIEKAGGIGTKNAMARSWLLYGEKVASPEVGDIVIFKRGNDGISGHVAFVYEKPSKLSPYIKVIGGNQGDAVSIANYLRANVLGYRRSKT